MTKTNKIIFISVVLLAMVGLVFAGVVKASTTGTILINIDNNGSKDPDCWVADGTCSVKWGDGSDHGHSITPSEFSNCMTQATKYASGLFDVSDLDITYQMVAKVVDCSNFDKNYTTYDTYRVSYAPRSNPVPVSVTCSAGPSSIQSGQSSIFTAVPSGGTGSYTYLWSGACTGSGINCSSAFSTSSASETKTATVVVTSGTQTNSANCSVSVSRSCTPEYEQRCVGTNLYWYNSCGVQGNYISTCGNTCTPEYQQRCVGTNLYWYNSCGVQGSYIGTCGQTGYGTLTVTKTVRNLTKGTGFATSTYASPSDVLLFLITVQNTGNQNVSNVFVRDLLPANLIYNNQLVVARSSNAYGNYSGDVAYGISLNTIPTGQTVTISYQVRVASDVNFSFGSTTLTNSVSVSSSATGYTPTASASVLVTKAGVLGASTISTGLTNNFWVDSFFLPLLLTLIGLWMWRAGMFSGMEKWLGKKQKVRNEILSEKELADRIANLQKLGRE